MHARVKKGQNQGAERERKRKATKGREEKMTEPN
jgi:hypothetical protein